MGAARLAYLTSRSWTARSSNTWVCPKRALSQRKGKRTTFSNFSQAAWHRRRKRRVGLWKVCCSFMFVVSLSFVACRMPCNGHSVNGRLIASLPTKQSIAEWQRVIEGLVLSVATRPGQCQLSSWRAASRWLVLPEAEQSSPPCREGHSDAHQTGCALLHTHTQVW